MNPELQRNLWLELTPRRMTQMALVLGLVLFTTNVASGPQRVSDVAKLLFYGIVVLWGARDAAQTVVGEIRERTWDFQRLSALSPLQITWGKLLGATSYVWFGGAICLAVVVGFDLLTGDSAHALLDVFFYSAIGLLAQAGALFASLIAVRRRQTRTRFNVFLYQAAGAGAAAFAWWMWAMANPIFGRDMPLRTIDWWGHTIDGPTFVLGSLGVFLAWVLIGCYRLMRLELQVQNRPTVWLVFIAFMAAYMAGFERIGPELPISAVIETTTLRLMLAHGTLVGLTYIAVLFEAKDRVLYRWLGEMLAKRRWGAVASRLQCWMISYVAAVLSGVALAVHLNSPDAEPVRAVLSVSMVVAGIGFLTRDLGIFVFFGLAPGQKRGDMPAVITLAILYVLLPRLFGGTSFGLTQIILLPLEKESWTGAAYAFAEAGAIWFAVFALRAKETAALPKASAGS